MVHAVSLLGAADVQSAGVLCVYVCACATSQVVWLELPLWTSTTLFTLQRARVLVRHCSPQTLLCLSFLFSTNWVTSNTFPRAKSSHTQPYSSCVCVCVCALCILPHCWGPGWLCRAREPGTSSDEGCRRSWGCGFLVRTAVRGKKDLLRVVFTFFHKNRGMTHKPIHRFPSHVLTTIKRMGNM